MTSVEVLLCNLYQPELSSFFSLPATTTLQEVKKKYFSLIGPNLNWKKTPIRFNFIGEASERKCLELKEDTKVSELPLSVTGVPLRVFVLHYLISADVPYYLTSRYGSSLNLEKLLKESCTTGTTFSWYWGLGKEKVEKVYDLIWQHASACLIGMEPVKVVTYRRNSSFHG